MKQIHTKNSLVLFVILASIVLGTMAPFVSCAKDNKDDANLVSEKGNVVETPVPPMIIWFHPVETDPEVLRLALSSGIFSHVMLAWLHEYDRPYDFAHPLSQKGLRNLSKALKLCKDKGVKVIWSRWLYPGYNHIKFPFKVEDIFSAKYYRERLRNIKEEGKLMGADFVALDSEPYGNSPLKPLRMGRYQLSEAKFNALKNAIGGAIEIEGQVDFVLPAGKGSQRHLYSAASSLGKLVIAEHTYRDVPHGRNDKRRRYDIFGAYVSITKKDPKIPNWPCFTPREILERQSLWSQKRGLFIFPGVARENVEAVALEFSKIKTIRPVPDNNDVR